ncbi:DNA-binding XRE family transcriptional regulator [Variovorax boronicumulans]|uniref:helix-turn-helix domain-containing protein n=1 Tax=Variovorax boronicumulans TaxID=436515 RepID=UPI002473064F|nr:helix-turn-helix domain-containing protein [Variovorax boronicumulans]MDH6166395.1 DNA-binding XRE family transcriptional regulator [Variovorax boronicumulans]
MPKNSHSLSALPSQTALPLERLGLRLRAHRVQREWTVAEMSERLLCSPNTLRALESGKPGTSIGLLAHTLWLFGEIDSLDGVAPAPAGLAGKRRVRRSAAQAAAGVIAEGERDF